MSFLRSWAFCGYIVWIMFNITDQENFMFPFLIFSILFSLAQALVQISLGYEIISELQQNLFFNIWKYFQVSLLICFKTSKAN